MNFINTTKIKNLFQNLQLSLESSNKTTNHCIVSIIFILLITWHTRNQIRFNNDKANFAKDLTTIKNLIHQIATILKGHKHSYVHEFMILKCKMGGASRDYMRTILGLSSLIGLLSTWWIQWYNSSNSGWTHFGYQVTQSSLYKPSPI